MRGLRVLLRLGGELALTAGVLLLLFLAWQLWWTDVQTGRQVSAEVAAVSSALATGDTGEGEESAAGVPGPAASRGALPEGVIGLAHLPTIGEQRVVRRGVAGDVLDQGVLGHYPETAGPGEVGNFALAGHRTTYSAPLWSIDELAPGDPVVVETREAYHVYRVERSRIVAPDQVEVLAAVPDRPGAEPRRATMVLTACHPRFSAAQRYVSYAVLERSVPRDEGPPSEVTALGEPDAAAPATVGVG